MNYNETYRYVAGDEKNKSSDKPPEEGFLGNRSSWGECERCRKKGWINSDKECDKCSEEKREFD